MTRERLLRETSSRELLEWEVLYERDPFGDRRADYHTAQIVFAIATSLGGAKELKLEDLLLSFQTEDREPQSAAFIEKALRGWVAAHNAAMQKKRQREADAAATPRAPRTRTKSKV